ncbi:MAG: DUF2169 domain-containing protein [Rhodocyclaceae bacterium]|nr:DUF2169 domain-containing protein [Rhodocyclaceae bacterium]
MRIIKPQHLSVLHRCFERQQRAYLGVAVMAYLPIQEEPALLPEQELWQQVAPLMHPEVPLDAALPKSGAEYLMIGDACAPGGEPVTGLEVEVRVGALVKRLHVYGERYWLDRQRISDVRPFVRMPLGWEQAWGGPKVPENPVGRGTAPEQTAAGPLLAVPPVQHPDYPCTSPKEPAMPASFGPIPPMWPQRKQFDGSYDDAWLKEEFPGPPRDFDWRYHCIASADQWQAAAFDGSEAIEIGHMHPEHARLQFRLPGIRPVVLARMKRGEGFKDRLGEPRLTTVWLLPNQLRAVLVWHAMFEVADEFADEVELLCAAFEWRDEPRPPEYYVDAIAARLDPEHGAEKLLDDFELLPDGLATPNELVEHFRESLGNSGVDVNRINEQLADAEKQVDDAMLKAHGAEFANAARQAAATAINRSGLPRPPTHVPPDPTGMLSASRSLFASMPRPSDMRSALSARQNELRSHFGKVLREQGVDEGEVSRLLHPTPPAVTETPRQMMSRFDSMIAQATRMPDVQVPRVDQRLRDLVDRAESMQSSLTRGVAHMQPAPPPLAREVASRWRDSAARARQAGQSFAGLKLKSADFKGMDLSGVDFSGGELEGVDFSGATLTGANFANACLAHAKFRGAKLDGASMVGANIGKADFGEASCVGVQFTDAIVQFTRLAKANLEGSDWRGVTLLEVDAAESRWPGARLGQATLIKCKLGGCVFTGADLTRATVLECELPAADFSEASAESADFITCLLDGARFDKCHAPNVRFVYRSSLKGASFRGAEMPKSNFRATPLEESDFTAALLDGADLSEARCGQCCFEAASLKGALIMKADFSAARMARSNLMQTVAQHAVFNGADLRDCNLYGSDLARVDVDTETRLDNAYMAKARTLPRRKVLSPGSSRKDG